MRLLALPLSALLLALPAAAQDVDEPVTPASVVEASSPDEWVEIAPEDLLVMQLQPEADGSERRVVIQLMPAPFSQPWVENIRTLARAHWWDGTSVYRVVDNWVAQWGDVTEEKELPEGVVSPEESYSLSRWAFCTWSRDDGSHGVMDCPFVGLNFDDIYLPDGFAGFVEGWPIAQSGNVRWPTHCYGSVGVARDIETTGTGSELYAVIGHAPRQLDRNIAVVGRVIDGIEHLSTLRRGSGDAGVYADRAEDTPIISVRMGDELATPPVYEYLSTDSESFARYVEVRANRNDAFYTVPAGGIDICNVQVPIRQVPGE